jgi:ribosomal protein S18 acetylase RimI-like enzyme
MPISFQAITPADVAAFCDCAHAVARESGFLACPSPAQLERQALANITSGDVHILAVDGKRVAGWGQVLRGQGDAVAHRADVTLGVRSEYRGQGLGQRLLRACVEDAAARGIAYLELEVRSDNRRAMKLYRCAGFSAVSIVRDAMRVSGVAYDALRMSLSIERSPR